MNEAGKNLKKRKKKQSSCRNVDFKMASLSHWNLWADYFAEIYADLPYS